MADQAAPKTEPKKDGGNKGKGKEKKEKGKKEAPKQEQPKQAEASTDKKEKKPADTPAPKKEGKKKKDKDQNKDDKPVESEKKAEKKEKKEKKEVPAAEDEKIVLEFTLPAAAADEKVTSKQIKAKVKDAFNGYGVIDEVRVQGEGDRLIVVFFGKMLAKGQGVKDALSKGEKPTISVFGITPELSVSNAVGSGGGATSGTSNRPKKEKEGGAKDGAGRGRGRGRDRGDKDGKEVGADGKMPERPKRPEPTKIGPIGRANGGPRPARVVLPRSKEAKAKLEDEKKKKEQKAAASGDKGGKEGKEEGGKKDGKKEGGKKEEGKKEAAPKKEKAKKE